MSTATAYTITTIPNGVALEMDDPRATFELCGIRITRKSQQVMGTLTVKDGDGTLLLRDDVALSTTKGRGVVCKALAGKGLTITEAPLMALDEDARQNRNDARTDRGGSPADGAGYEVTPNGIVWKRDTAHGVVPTPLTNFGARIVADVRRDDGAETTRTFAIEATCGDRGATFIVPAGRFAAMTWPTEHLGAGAIIYPGQNLRDHARTAIQVLSGTVPERTVYTHTGWREIRGAHVYLHAAGAIGAAGALVDVDVEFPSALGGFALPPASTPDKTRAAVRAGLRLLETLAPPRISVPLVASIYRAAMGGTDYAVHLAGRTGVFKSEVAAVAQQHYGAGLDARHLPAAWASTANALEGLAFAAKDTLLVVDDFAPGGSTIDVQRMHREADRLLRAQGNAAGRQRMRADTTLRPAHPPRGLILSTGEDVPRGQSLRARMFVLEILPGEVPAAALTVCQAAAATGEYARAMTAYIQWLAGRYPDVRAHWPALVGAFREAAYAADGHRRTAAIVAELAAGLALVLVFAEEIGACSTADLDVRWPTYWSALGEAAEAQAEHQTAADPVRRFMDLLRAALVSGHAHLVDRDGDAPANCQAFGWRRNDADWVRGGQCVGWLDGADLYLDPETAYQVAQRGAGIGGDSLGVSALTLRKRLDERGLLQSTETRGGKRRLDVRRVLSGARRSVLHLSASTVTGEGLSPDETVSQVAHDPAKPSRAAAKSWATSWATVRVRVAHGVAHDSRNGTGNVAARGPLGTPRGTGESQPGADTLDTCGGMTAADGWTL